MSWAYKAESARFLDVAVFKIGNLHKQAVKIIPCETINSQVYFRYSFTIFSGILLTPQEEVYYDTQNVEYE